MIEITHGNRLMMFEPALYNIAKLYSNDWDTSRDFFLTKKCPEHYFERFGVLCKNLIHNGNFDIIFQCIFLLFSDGDGKPDYDLATISELFGKIMVNDNYTLADIRDLFLAELEKAVDTDDDIYIDNHNYCSFSHFAIALKRTICKYILSIPEKDIPNSIPESFVETVCEKCAELKSELSTDYIERYTVGILLALARTYRFEAVSDVFLPRVYYISLAKTKVLPLCVKHYSKYRFPAAIHYELCIFLDELLYALNPSHIFTFKKFNHASSIDEVIHTDVDAEQFLRIINERFDCSELLYKLNSCRVYNFWDLPEDLKDFKKGKKITDRENAKYLLDHSDLGTHIVDAVLCLDKSKCPLCRINTETVTSLFVCGIVLMFLNGEQEKCRKILLKHNDMITDRYIHAPFMKLIIAKLIMSCSDRHEAEKLKVLSQISFSRSDYENLENEVINFALPLTESMMAAEKFIKGEIEEFVRLSKLDLSADEIEDCEMVSRRFKRKGIDKLLYETAKIDAFINPLNKKLKEGKLPSRREFIKLCSTAEAFAHDQGVYLGALSDIYPEVSSYFYEIDADGNRRSRCVDDKFFGNHYFFKLIYPILSENKDFINIHYPQIDHAPLWYSIENEFDKIIEVLVQRSAYENYQYAKECLVKQQQEDSIFMHVLEERAKEFSENIPREITDVETAKQMINDQTKRFVETFFPETPDMDIYSKLSSDIKKLVQDELLTSHSVFNFIASLEKYCPDLRLDYSAALISLTSSIELVLCEKFYKKIANNIKAARNRNQNNRSYAIPNTPSTKSNPTFGECVYMLWDIFDNNISKIVVSNGKLTVTNPNRHFDYYGGNDCLDIPGLKRFKDLDLNILYYTPGNDGKSERIETTRRFGDDDEENRLIFACALDYIRDKFRNPAAHKEFVEKSTFENAKRSLLYGKELANAQGVLWILLSILK